VSATDSDSEPSCGREKGWGSRRQANGCTAGSHYITAVYRYFASRSLKPLTQLWYCGTRMPDKERRKGREVPPPRPSRDAENQYRRVARYESEQLSDEAYTQSQELLRATDNDLSTFRLLSPDERWYVAVIGAEPHAEIDQIIRRIFETGEAVELPLEIIQQLLERRRLVVDSGETWVERHYRLVPRKRLRRQ
jgi:hypothetical protein